MNVRINRIRDKFMKNKITHIFAVAFILIFLSMQGKVSASSSMTTISGPSSFDTPSLLASLVYTNMGNNTVQESLQVSSFGNYPSDEDSDKANQSYGSLSAPSKGTSLKQGKALQSYIYTLDALGLEGKLYSQGENPPDIAVNGDTYSASNSEIFPNKDDTVKVLWKKTSIKTWSGAWQSFLFAFFNAIGSFFAGFCDLANKLIDKFVDIYASIPALFANGAEGKGFIFDILNGIAGLFGVSSFFLMVRQIVAPYALGGVIISLGVAGIYLSRPRPQYRNALASIWHIVFRLVMFVSGFALLGWSYTTIISPFQNAITDVTSKTNALNDPKSQSIDALAWGISTNFSLDSSVTGVALDQTQLESGLVQSSLINNPTVVSNINQKSIDILGKKTLSALSSPLQYEDKFTNSKNPYTDEWNQSMNQTVSGTFSYEDYLNGMAVAMKSKENIEAMNSPLDNTSNKQLVAGGYFGDGDYYYGSKYGINNFNTKTYLFVANPKNGYDSFKAPSFDDSPVGEKAGTMSITLSNPADGGKSLEIKNLAKTKPFWAIPVEATNFESYLFGAVPAQSMTTQTSATYTGLSQDMQFADIAEMNEKGTYLTQDSQGNISGIADTKDNHLRNNAYQVVLMNKEAGVNPATASNSTYFQFSTQSALFFLNSEMTSSGALKFNFPNGINFTGSQGNSTKKAYFNRMISISAGAQASNVVLNSFKFMVYAMIFICIMVALLNTMFLKKMVENVMSYGSFVATGHLVDFVAGITLSLAFVLLKVTTQLGVAVGSVFYTAVNKALVDITHTDTSDVTMVCLWGIASLIITTVILFIPVTPSAQLLLAGNSVKEAKQKRKFFESGKEMATTSGSGVAVAGAAVLGAVSWLADRMARSIPAVIVILPIIFQKTLMESIASVLVAVQDGSFIGNRGGVNRGSKSITQEKINKKIRKSRGGRLGVEDVANALDPSQKGGLNGIGKNVGGKRKGNGADGAGGKKTTPTGGKKNPTGESDKTGKNKTGGIGKDGNIGKKKTDGTSKNKKTKDEFKDGMVDTDKLIDPKTGELVKPDDFARKEEILTDKYIKDGLVWANAKNQAKKDIENEKSRKANAQTKERIEKEKREKRELQEEKALMAKGLNKKTEDISDKEALTHRRHRIAKGQARDVKNAQEEKKQRIKAQIKKTPVARRDDRKELRKEYKESKEMINRQKEAIAKTDEMYESLAHQKIVEKLKERRRQEEES